MRHFVLVFGTLWELLSLSVIWYWPIIGALGLCAVDRLYICSLWLSLVDISCHNVTSNRSPWGRDAGAHRHRPQLGPSVIKNAASGGHEAPDGGTIRWPSVSRLDISPREPPSIQTNNSHHPSSPQLAEAWDGPKAAVRPLCSAIINYRRGNDPSATAVHHRAAVVASPREPALPKTGRKKCAESRFADLWLIQPWTTSPLGAFVHPQRHRLAFLPEELNNRPSVQAQPAHEPSSYRGGLMSPLHAEGQWCWWESAVLLFVMQKDKTILKTVWIGLFGSAAVSSSRHPFSSRQQVEDGDNGDWWVDIILPNASQPLTFSRRVCTAGSEGLL